MLASALIVFREVLEAALVIGIVMAAAKGVRRRGLWISAGCIAGLIGACLVAVFANSISSALEGMGQEMFNASALFAAVIMLGWHNVWMGRHGRELSRHAGELGRSVSNGGRPLYALAFVCGLAVLREGSEVVLFLYGIAASQTAVGAMFAGGFLGLAGGIAAWGTLYAGLLRIPTRHLFVVTSWMILLLAAGMAAQGAGYLVQADVLPSLGNQVWNTSGFLSERSILGQTLHTLVGYIARPAGIQVVFYLVTIAIIGGLMLLIPDESPTNRRASTAVGLAVLALLLLNPGAAQAAFKVYSPVVIGHEWELETRGVVDRDSNTSKDHKQKQIYEIGYAPTDRWATAIFAELEKPPGGSLKTEAVAWENILQLFEQGEKWIDAGLYGEYEASTRGGPDKIEAKVLLEKPVGNFVHTANLIFEKEIGSGAEDSVELGYAWRTGLRLMPEFEPSIEAFGEFGPIDDFKSGSQQKHNIGPVMRGLLGVFGTLHLRYELGYLFGLTDGSANGEIKWLLELEGYL